MAGTREHSSRIHPSLERAPGTRDNWVEQSGGLPSYIDRIARHLHYDQGMTISRAIASAVSTTKRWARGGGAVKADTRAKAAAAVAQWEAKKAKSKARTAAKRADLAAPPFWGLGTVWELAISSHGWVPNNPVTALKWRKGHWTPPGGGKAVSAADIRARLGAKSNKDAIRILTSDPAAINKVTGRKASAKRPVRGVRTAPGRTPGPSPSGPGADPTRRQTLRANTAPASGRTVDRAAAARTAETTRKANRPAERPSEVSPDMGRQALPRDGGPKRAANGEITDTGWVAVPRGESAKVRAQVASQRRGEVVQKATKYRPFEVVKRSGRFHVRDTRDQMTSGAMAKAAALATAKVSNDQAQKRGGPLEDLGSGYQVRRDSHGWQLYRNGQAVSGDNYRSRQAAVDAAAGIPSADQATWAVAKQRRDAATLRRRAGVESTRERTAREKAAAGRPPIGKSAVRNRPRRGASAAPDVSTPAGRRQVREQTRATEERQNTAAKAQRARVESAGAAAGAGEGGTAASTPGKGRERAHRNVSPAYEDAASRPGGAYITENPDGNTDPERRWIVRDGLPEGREYRANPFYLHVKDGVWTRHRDGRERVYRKPPGSPEIGRPIGWSPKWEFEDLAPDEQARIRAKREADAAAQTRQRDQKTRDLAPARARQRLAKLTYELDLNWFKKANVGTTARERFGDKAWEALGQGGPEAALRSLKESAEELRQGKHGATSSKPFAIDRAVRLLQGRLSKPKNGVVALVPYGPIRDAGDGGIVREVVDQDGRVWEMKADNGQGRLSLTSGGRTGQTTFTPNKSSEAHEAAEKLAASLMATPAKPAAKAAAKTTPPRRQSGGRPPSGAREGALFGLTPDQKRDQKDRVADAIGDIADGSPARAADTLLRGNPVVRQVRDDDGDVTMRVEIKRDPQGGWQFATAAPSSERRGARMVASGSGRGLSLTDAVEGAEQAYRDRYGSDMPDAAAAPKPKRATTPKSGATPAAAKQKKAPDAEKTAAPPAPAAPARTDRDPGTVAREQAESEWAAAEKRRAAELPALREALAAAERAATAYERRHPTASTRSPTVVGRVADKRRAVARARERLADAEVGAYGAPPTQSQFAAAREPADAAVRSWLGYRDKLRGTTPTPRQQADLDRRHAAAVTAVRRFLDVERARGEGEQRAARENASKPFRVYSRRGGGFEGFRDQRAAEDRAESLGFSGRRAQVFTRSGELQVTYNRSNQPQRGELTDADLNATYERAEMDRINTLDSPDVLQQWARYNDKQRADASSDAERDMFARLSAAAQAQVEPARQRIAAEQAAEQQFSRRYRELRTGADQAFRSGDLPAAERAVTELIDFLRDNPRADDAQRTSASRALDRIEQLRGSAPQAPASDAGRIGAAREALEATRAEMDALQEKWNASQKRHRGTPTARVQANRERMRSRASELQVQRAEQQRALLAALHPDTKQGTPTVTRSEQRAWGGGVVEDVTFPDGGRYTVERNRGSATVRRGGLSTTTYDTVASMGAADYARQMGATLDRIAASAVRRDTDAHGRPRYAFADRDAMASALARLDPVNTYVSRDAATGHYRLHTSLPERTDGPYLAYGAGEYGQGWRLDNNGAAGGRAEFADATLTPEDLRVLSRETPTVDVSHESARTGYHTSGTLTGDRRRAPGGGIEVQIRYPNGTTVWIPISIVAGQLRE